MKPVFLTLAIFFSFCFCCDAQQCRFEKSGGKESATYFEAIDWYKMLDKRSPKVLMKTMGATDAGYPLNLVLVSNDGNTDIAQWKKEKRMILLFNNGIHPGEPDGIDASMMLVRDIANGKVKILSNVGLAFIPVYNIGGCLNRNSYSRVNQNGPEQYGFRGNSENLDLNRDFTKCDSKEARAFAEIFHLLDPDILMDNHVSDGADYQHPMTLIATQYNKLGKTLGMFLKNNFEPSVYKNMSAKGWDMFPYVNFETEKPETGMEMFYDPPRYSSGYAALFQTISFIPETHMLKPYKDRVKSTYDLMIAMTEEASLHAKELKASREAERKAIQQQKNFPLSWKVDTTQSSTVTFLGYEAAFKTSDATGLQRMYYDHSKPFTKEVKYFNVFTPINMIQKPKAYIIPRGWYKAVNLLKLNGVVCKQLDKDTTIAVQAYHIDEYKSLPRPYENHHKNSGVKVTPSMQDIHFLKGDYYISTDQLNSRYLVEMLEPTGDDSFFSWNFFDGILQQKEGYSDYRWEDVAAAWLQKNPDLQKQLADKKATDSSFAKNSNAQLDFIYKHSPYYEPAHLRYPVYRLL